jgi:hypothetical protein
VDGGVGGLRRNALFGEVCASIIILGQAATILPRVVAGNELPPTEFAYLGLAVAYGVIYDAARRLARGIAIIERPQTVDASADAL